MCGIIGLIEPKENFKSIKELQEFIERGFILNRHRGTDSYGSMIFLKNKKYFIVKSLTLKGWREKFNKKLENIEIDDILMVINHHRKATVGLVNIRLQHPVIIESKDKKNRVYVIQNGTKEKLQEIVIEELGLDKEKDKEEINQISDTWAIGYIYNTLKPYKSYIHFQAMINFLKKSGVVFIYDKQRKKLLFHKDATRQLWYSKELKLFTSEPIMAGSWYKIKSIDWFGDLNRFVDKIPTFVDKIERKFVEEVCIRCNKPFIKETDTYILTCKSCRKNNYTYTVYPSTTTTKHKDVKKRNIVKYKSTNVKSVNNSSYVKKTTNFLKK
jgi:predicted glutamine amidotransferase/ribosomal protein L37AE/L43A